MSTNLPPLIPPSGCPSNPVAISTPVLLRSAVEGPPNTNFGAPAGIILDPNVVMNEGNELVVVAKNDGISGNSISVQITSPAVGAILTTINVSGNAITIIPSERARMYVEDAEDTRFNGVYREAGNYPGTTRPMWVMINAGPMPPRIIFPQPDGIPSGKWEFDLSDGVSIYESDDVAYDITNQPETLPFKFASDGTPSNITMTPMSSDAGQVVNAFNLSSAASALVSVSLLIPNSGYAPVVQMAAQLLNGGLEPSVGTVADGIGQLCRVGPYVIDPPRIYAYDWYIADEIDYWRPIFVDP